MRLTGWLSTCAVLFSSAGFARAHEAPRAHITPTVDGDPGDTAIEAVNGDRNLGYIDASVFGTLSLID